MVGRQNDEIRMTRLRKENDKYDVGNLSIDERKILPAMNNDNQLDNGRGKYMAKNVVLVNGESQQKATSSTHVAKICKTTLNAEYAARPSVEKQKTDSADAHVAHTEMNTDLHEPQPQEDNEMTIVDVRMAKYVTHGWVSKKLVGSCTTCEGFKW